ncbi:MAG: thioredoxin domain-containing protein [Elusimicrobiota bacterium]
MKCPNCGYEQTDGTTECEKCQVIFEKWYQKKELENFGRDSAENKNSKSKNWNFLIVVSCVVLLIFFVSNYLKNRKEELTLSSNFNANASIEKIITISEGEEVDINRYLVKDYVVIFDFYADWCGPCRELGPYIEDLTKQYNDVLIRKININSWGSPICKQYQIGSVPNVWVYNKEGKLVGEPTFKYNDIVKNVKRARKEKDIR